MGKKLVIAEKPSVGRDLARVLKCAGKGDGFLYNEDYAVSWAIGHLAELCEPEDYDAKYKKWTFDALPIIPDEIKLKAAAKTKAQYNILKNLMNGAETDSIICATDSGREGELIFRYIYSLAKCVKPFQRLWISSMTDAAIREGFERLKDGGEYDNLYVSAKCRSEADWLVGINASRAFTLKYGALLSLGRVQTPTLAMLVNRQTEINAFVPNDYWEVEAEFEPAENAGRSYGGKWYAVSEDGTICHAIQSEAKALEIVNNVKGRAGEVVSVEKEDKKQPPPLLYDLTELQRDCNYRFGYTANKTLSIAQDLYEKRKMITYPRTDSRYLPSDMTGRLPGIVKRLSAAGDFKNYADYILALPKLPVTKRLVDNAKISDHHAIIPADSVLSADKLTTEEKNVFALIAKRFLAAFYPYYEYCVTTIVTAVNGERFLSKGRTVVQPGWMEIYKDDANNKNNDGGGAQLPGITAGEAVTAVKAEAVKKQTQPPKPYTDATLLSAMENAGRFIEDEELKERMKESGLGTPATRAAIFERLITVGYAVRKGKTLIPTEKGMKIIGIVPRELKSPETTGKWEKGLSGVAKGSMGGDRFMASIKRYVGYIIDEAGKAPANAAGIFPEETKRNGRYAKKGQYAGKSNKKSGGIKEPKKTFGKCPLCGSGDVYENSKAYYCGDWKKGCKLTVWKSYINKSQGELTNEKIIEYIAAIGSKK